MKIFSKVINDKTKLLDCIVCGDTPVLDGYSELEREIGYDGQWYLKGYAPQKPQEIKEQEVRAVRNSYLKKYIDDRAKSPFMWDEVSDEEKEILREYRKYLMDYPETAEDWFEQNPKTLEEWKI